VAAHERSRAGRDAKNDRLPDEYGDVNIYPRLGPSWTRVGIYYFFGLFNFMTKYNSRKSKITFLAVKNSPELRKITGNILETLGKISNSTK
jgi:hypothetical protein